MTFTFQNRVNSLTNCAVFFGLVHGCQWQMKIQKTLDGFTREVRLQKKISSSAILLIWDSWILFSALSWFVGTICTGVKGWCHSSWHGIQRFSTPAWSNLHVALPVVSGFQRYIWGFSWSNGDDAVAKSVDNYDAIVFLFSIGTCLYNFGHHRFEQPPIKLCWRKFRGCFI